MGFWSRMFGWDPDGAPNHADMTPNANDPAPAPGTVGPPDWRPGDPEGLEIEGPETFSRALPFVAPSPWSGWPQQWSTPMFNTQLGFNRLVDTAWACLDKNSSTLAAMPVYRMQSGQIVAPATWMVNPDPLIYNNWYEFAKQLFWDYQIGEAFVLPMAYGSNGKPLRFRVVPPWLVNIEMSGGTREYTLGGEDVSREILHIRYQSDTAYAHGRGPLEVAGARIVASGLLQRYADRIAETGGVPLYWMEVLKRLDAAEADDLLDRWVESRRRRAGEPALVTGGAALKQAQVMSAKDMTLMELAQFSDSRIAVLCGVPPFLVGLPSGGDSMTYSNVSQLFDFHDRATLKPFATDVMSALSGWALPRGQSAELNRDEYSRPDFAARAGAYKTYVEIGALDAEDVRQMERFVGERGPAGLTGSEPAEPTEPAEPAGDQQESMSNG